MPFLLHNTEKCDRSLMSLIVPLNELASLVRRVVLLPRPVRPCPLRPRPPRQAFLLPDTPAIVPVALLPVPPGGVVVLVLMFLRRKKGYR
jgi:hypothetical protein